MRITDNNFVKRLGWVASGVFAVLSWCASPSYADTNENSCRESNTFSLAVHGGSLTRVIDLSDRVEFIRQLLTEGREKLKNGMTSLDAVEWSVRRLEDSGIFNAGKGSIANGAGFVETDASIMDGRNRTAGAVASMLGLKNPVSAARLVMEKSTHVLVVGDRGETFVRSLGADTVPPSYFVRNKPLDDKKPHGTVGAVALDRCGNLAAATSTGGFFPKTPGRVGDSPLPGAGVFADNATAAISATGHGEYLIRFNASSDIAARMQYSHFPLDEAVDAVVNDVLKPVGGEAGIIAVDRHGHVVMNYNSAGMLRGYTTQDHAPEAAAY